MIASESQPRQRSSALEILRTQSLTSVAQDEIERMIWNGELRPKERLNEVALASQLGISRGPIREACRALAAVGLLDVARSRGFSVRHLTENEIADLYEVRAGLDGYAGMLLAHRLDADGLARLSALVDTMEEAAIGEDVDKYYGLNLEFHHEMIALAKNERLTQIYEGIIRQLHLCRVSALSQAGALASSNAEHWLIVDSLSSKDPQRAFEAISKHVQSSYGRMMALLKEAS